MIAYLFQNRLKPGLFSPSWVKSWMKRVWTLPSLLGYCWQSVRWSMKGARIAPSAVISNLTLHGESSNLIIGEGCSVGVTRMQAHAEIRIGKCVVINDGVRLVTGSHDINSPTYDHVFAPIVVEDYAWVATDAMVLKGVTIGRGAVVAAGAVVVKDVRPFTVVGGNPAKEICTRTIERFDYMPSSWFGPVMAWVGRNPVQDHPQPGTPAMIHLPAAELVSN